MQERNVKDYLEVFGKIPHYSMLCAPYRFRLKGLIHPYLTGALIK
jgi:hypothetical protein